MEKGPLESIAATLARQSKSARPASRGTTAIACVTPPPFFHGLDGNVRRS